MRYFLSYVESGIHASVMLSTQEQSDAPVKVAFEAGFDIDPGDGKPSIFGKQQGYYVQEEAASKAAYSGIPVRHRTYEISQAEADTFYKLMAEKHWHGDELEDMSKGHEFQLLSNNCKVYALGIFKELGVFEADCLSNTFLPITRTTKSKMEKVDRDMLACPIKEKFIKDFRNFAEMLNQIIPEMSALVTLPAVQNAIDSMKQMLEEVNGREHKIAIEESLAGKVNTLMSLTDTVTNIVFEELAKEESIEEYQIRELASHLAALRQHRQAVVVDVAEIKRLSEDGGLPFEWTSVPSVAKRVRLDNFEPDELEMYEIRYKSNEITDGLSDMSQMIKDRLERGKLSDDARTDLGELAAMVVKAEEELQKSAKTLAEKEKSTDPSEVLEAYRAHKRELEGIVKSLDKKLADFQPKDQKQTSGIVGFMRKVTNLFKKESSQFKYDPKKVMATKLHGLQQEKVESKSFDYKKGLAFIRQSFGRSKKEGDTPAPVEGVESDPNSGPKSEANSKPAPK